MSGPFDHESDASHLRKALASHSLASDTKLLFGATFLASLRETNVPPEVYLREFFPSLAALAARLTKASFLPREQAIIAEMVALAEENLATYDCAVEIASFGHLLPGISTDAPEPTPIRAEYLADNAVTVDCFFVEDHPELKFASRGRLLQLRATGLVLPKATEDDILVVNPLEQPEDPFLGQARDSVAAARGLLERDHGLSSGQYFQIKFAIDSTGARFTGDSLGAAFAVAAVALLTRLAAMRRTARISPGVSLTGALTRQARLRTINLEGLKLKIERAFYSRIRWLVVPAEHLSDAQAHLDALSAAQNSGNSLGLIGADDLSALISDPRVVTWSESSYPAYLGKQFLRKFRSRWVEVPILIVLVLLLSSLAFYFGDREPVALDFDRAETSVVNRYGHALWQLPKWGDVPYSPDNAILLDIDDNGTSEVLFVPSSQEKSARAGWLHIYSAGGDSLKSVDARICQEYPGDSLPCNEAFGDLWCGVFSARVNGDLRLITLVNRNNPARGQIKIWDSQANLRGWFINSGTCIFELAHDLDGDGKEELFFTGFANRMAGCAAWFLPADSARGVSPPYIRESATLDLTGVTRGNQLSYTLFSPSEIAKLYSPQEYQGGLQARTLERDMILVVSAEGKNPVSGSEVWLNYTFDSRFRLRSVSYDDHFKKERRLLIEQGKLPDIAEAAYLDSIACRVRYWQDSGWVTEGELRESGLHTP